MAWAGANLKELAKDKGITQTKISQLLKVSRQTVSDWIKGQTPKGDHLIELSRILEVDPGYFFTPAEQKAISIPLHRKRGVAKLTDAMKQDSFKMAHQYEKLFMEAPDPGLVPVLRINHRDKQHAMTMASELRRLSGVESDKPIDYTQTFKLFSLLNIVTIFRYFPQSVKDYAFYCQIHKHRVVFVNNSTNVLDLIFPLLHEAILAIRDEEGDNRHDPVEEDFCDLVAHYIQFPRDYVSLIADAIMNRRISQQINMLKKFCSDNGHSMFGITKEIKKLYPNFNIEIGGANSNLKKTFRTIGDILFLEKDSRDFVDMLKILSPHFLNIILDRIEYTTTRKLTGWLGLESILDGKQVIEELMRRKGKK